MQFPLLIFCFLSISLTYGKLNLNLIKDFLTENHLKICLFLSCEGVVKNVQLFKTAQSEGIWTNVLDISNGTSSLDFDKTFQYSTSHIAVIIDLKCRQTSEIFSIISKKMWFHQRYFWLIFAPDMDLAHTILENQNINLDAEITLAIPMEDDRFLTE